jgi:hypothetical protein
MDWPARTGRDLDPSSIPPLAHGKLKFFATMLPYQASFGVDGHGISSVDAGWQPTCT